MKSKIYNMKSKDDNFILIKNISELSKGDVVSCQVDTDKVLKQVGVKIIGDVFIGKVLEVKLNNYVDTTLGRMLCPNCIFIKLLFVDNKPYVYNSKYEVHGWNEKDSIIKKLS